MSQKSNTIAFQFPFRTYLAHDALGFLLVFIPFIPLAILVIIHLISSSYVDRITLELGLSITMIIALPLILLLVYTKINKKITVPVYLNYILKNLSCPKCYNKLSSYEKQYPQAYLFYEYSFICDFCKTENVVEVDEDAKKLRTTWLLTKKKPLKMDLEEFKKIVENTKNEEEYVEATSKLDLTSNELMQLVEEYRRKYGIPEQIECDKRVRKITFLTLAIWIILGALVYYFLILKYKILPYIEIEYMFCIVILLFLLTIVFFAWRDHKKGK